MGKRGLRGRSGNWSGVGVCGSRRVCGVRRRGWGDLSDRDVFTVTIIISLVLTTKRQPQHD